MEPDRQFLQLLDQLRQSYDSLQLEHTRKVAALETEVAQLRGSPAYPAAQEGDAGRGDKPERQDKAAVALDIPDILEKDRAPNAAENNTAPVDQATTGSSRKKRPGSNFSLMHHEESRIDKRWGHFDAFIGGAIILYTAVMWIQLHVDGMKNEMILLDESRPDHGLQASAAAFVEVMEHVFNVLFLIEFIIRVYFFRWRFFYDECIQWFHLFDASLVWITLLEAYILSSLSINLSYIRSVRIIRLLRSLRVVRTFSFFTSLRILVSTVAASFLALFWSMVLLGAVMLMGALTLCQLLGSSVTDDGLALGTRIWVNRYYGTPSKSLWTMFEMTFSGCWPNYARTVIEEVSSLYILFFVVYIAGVVFAMTRIITALFLKDTLAIANTDSDMQINSKMKEKQAYARKLQAFFEEADASGEADGFITEAEFVAVLKEPRAAAYMTYLEIDPTESLHLFQIIDDGDGRISSEEFVRSALRLKGAARAQDLIILMHELHKVRGEVENIQKVAKATQDTCCEVLQLNANAKATQERCC